MQPLKSILSDTPLAELVDMDCTQDDNVGAVKLTNEVELKLVKTLGIDTRGYDVGSFPALFSRNNRSDAPDWEYLANGGRVKRLLDKPVITQWLIDITIAHTKNLLNALLRANPTHFVSWARLAHTKNIKKHRQSASLLSYIVRTFCPDDMPALSLNPEAEITDAEIKKIILSLPIDPAKISDEVLVKMDLAPDDYDTYSAQARLRYKLWIRKRFLAILAEAHVFERQPTHTAKGRTTARIMAFKTEADEWKVATFATKTDKYDHRTWHESPRIHRKKISQTTFRILQNTGALLRSQEHTLTHLLKKGEEITEYLTLFEAYKSMTPETRFEFVVEAFTYFSALEDYYGEKIADFLKQLPKNPSMIGNINRTLREMLGDIEGKVYEIDNAYCLLLEKWDKIGNYRNTQSSGDEPALPVSIAFCLK